MEKHGSGDPCPKHRHPEIELLPKKYRTFPGAERRQNLRENVCSQNT
jgi:hypothetical protein